MANPTIERMHQQPVSLITEQIERLRALFPEVFSEDRIDFDKLKATVGNIIDDRQERYSFSWAGKRDALRTLQAPTWGTLKPSPDESINFDMTQHLFIEGENLEVLKLLYRSYFGQVKMIYIDPPYNTGRDMIYLDDFHHPKDAYLRMTGQTDEEGNLLTSNPETSGRYHSDWLSMMYPRLFLARQLLRDDGLIFVSIDDHEIQNLRLLMNEVFGEENFIAQLVWNTDGHTDNQYAVKVNHEYVCLYARSADKAELGYVVAPETREESNLWKGFAENSITKNGSANPPSQVVLPAGFPCAAESLDLSPTMVDDEYFSEVDSNGFISRTITRRYSVSYPIRLDSMIVEDGVLKDPCRVFSGWANVGKLRSFIENGCQPITDTDGSTLHFYLSSGGVIYYRREDRKARHILSILRGLGTTERMRSELEEMGLHFDYPKPKELLSYLIQIGIGDAYQESIILDFFAGSCTTAHSVLELNRQDGGHRRFIMIQMPEQTAPNSEARSAGYMTITDLAKERIRRVIKAMKPELGIQPNLHESMSQDLGFAVFTLAESNWQQWQELPADTSPEDYAEALELFHDPLIGNWQAEDVVYEVLLREGLSLTSRVERVNSLPEDVTVWRVTDEDKEQSLLICLDGHFELETARALNLTQEDLLICRDVAIDDTAAANLALQCRLKLI